jgi:undecaprenyl-diphosphatase
MLIFYLFIFTQVVLESFPVSSSGHIALLELIMRTSFERLVVQQNQIGNYQAVSSVYHLLHGISALVIALFFINSWWPLLRHWRRCWHQIVRAVVNVGIADIITGCFFILMHWYDRSWFPVGCGFVITASALASLYWCRPKIYTPYSWRHALVLGVVQGCALFPGISRFGLTYVVGRWLRLTPYKAFEVSFLIEWPLITAACLASLPILGNPFIYEQFLNPITLLVILGSGGIAWCALALVAYLIRTHRLWLFAWYMILPLLLWLMRACI